MTYIEVEEDKMFAEINRHSFLGTNKGSAFGESVPQAAWKTIPSWYIVAQDDQALNPNLERFFAKRIGAKTTEIKSSHVPFISHPAEVARLIEQAAIAAGK